MLDNFYQHQKLNGANNLAVKDSSIFDSVEVMGKTLRKIKIIPEEEWKMYSEVYQLLEPRCEKPLLLIFLDTKVSTLKTRIALRARDFEKNISDTYLTQIDSGYRQWISTWRHCPIETISTDGETVDAIIAKTCHLLKNHL